MPFLVALSFLAAVRLGAERPLSLGTAGGHRRGGRAQTGLRALQQAFVNGPRLPGRAVGGRPPQARGLSLAGHRCSGTTAARQEEAFFWPKNNTRVSPGTSLLHPLPSIVSTTQSQAPGLCAAWEGGGGGEEQERLAMCVMPQVCLHFPGWARVLETADGQADQACVRGHRALPAG